MRAAGCPPLHVSLRNIRPDSIRRSNLPELFTCITDMLGKGAQRWTPCALHLVSCTGHFTSHSPIKSSALAARPRTLFQTFIALRRGEDARKRDHDAKVHKIV